MSTEPARVRTSIPDPGTCGSVKFRSSEAVSVKLPEKVRPPPLPLQPAMNGPRTSAVMAMQVRVGNIDHPSVGPVLHDSEREQTAYYLVKHRPVSRGSAELLAKEPPLQSLLGDAPCPYDFKAGACH